MKAKFMNQAILLLCFLASSLPLLAQPTTPSDAPVDGGLSLLVAGGVGYGIKKMREHKKQQRENNQD
ncbi:MAG: hypothetical protein J0I09_03970 [Sphingobacteriia bacterium]|nr:hypothetical protein [Sphingobacteriia bacterium]